MERRFYQMSKSSLPSAVSRLAAKVHARGDDLAIYAPDAARIDELSLAIWSEHEFMPHSLGQADGLSRITLYEGTGDLGDVIFVIDGLDVEVEKSLICYLFHSIDQDIVAKRRVDWKSWKEAGHHLTYWAENDHGAWTKMAEENAP